MIRETEVIFHQNGTFEEFPAGMGSPVRCRRCGGVYDLQAVHVTHRYADCSVFLTPCCHAQADDRQWKGSPDFRRLR